MQKREAAGNLDTGLLKIIALCCMVIDHVGARLLSTHIELRIIGRIAFPLYIWCMVVGTCYTKNPARYALRLLLAGLISQPFYMLGLNHGWDKWSIFMTLLMGYLGICGIRYNRFGSRWWAPVLVLLTACFVDMDYGWGGVMLIMLMYLARRSRGGIAAVMIAFCLYWGAGSGNIQQVFGCSLRELPLYNTPIARAFLHLQTMALLALPLILWPRTKRTPFPKWASYGAYAGHLFLLWLAQLALGVTNLAAARQLLIPWM